MTKPEASTQYSGVRFGYAKNDRTLSFAVGESWEWDGNPAHCPTNYTVTFAREFRYDDARARYLNRQLNPTALMQGNFVSLSDTWTDYDEDEGYGDFIVNGTTVTNRKSYEPGLAQVDPWMSSGGTATDYVMSDHLGTTRGLIMPNGSAVEPVVYTAFGERISGTNHRFGYVGSFGYQAHAEIPFLHVGARYYDPATGRFLQRDRIGIRGGLNVYDYTNAQPTISVDPGGLYTSLNPVTVAGAGLTIQDLIDMGIIVTAGTAVVKTAPVVGRVLMDAAERVARAKQLKEQLDRIEKYIQEQEDRIEDYTDPASADELRKNIEEGKKVRDDLRKRISDLFCG